MKIRLPRFRRAADRRLLAQAALTAIALGLCGTLIHKSDEAFAARAVAAGQTDPDAPAQFGLAIHDTRTCATVAVYSDATADDWGQRAVIAKASLNSFDADGVPDCAPALLRILELGLDHVRWKAALDAVDAVSNGSYAIPLACERADSVAPFDVITGASPLPGDPSARSQCVINGLAFWDSRA